MLSLLFNAAAPGIRRSGSQGFGPASSAKISFDFTRVLSGALEELCNQIRVSYLYRSRAR
jgi:hypothetical protein